jgi:hypothetical protein
MTTRALHNRHDIDGLARLLASRQLPVTVTITQGVDRSAQQNKLAFTWYREIADQLGDRDASDVRAHCKLYIGVRMLHAENDKFREQWDRLIKNRFTISEKLELMLAPHDYPVTRLMNVKQMTRYMDAIHAEFTGQGCRLTDPQALMYEQEITSQT